MSNRLVGLLATGALALALAACGSSSSNSSHPSASAGGSTLAISAPKGGALMFSTRSLTAKAGKVTIVFTNPASVPHDFELQHGSAGKVIGATPIFSGGSRTLVVNLKAGTYTYFCSVPGHRAAGMQGTLTVT